MNTEKTEVRKRIRSLRDAVPAEQRAAWTQRICAQALALPAYRSARTMHIFLSFQSEVDTRAIVEDAFAQGKRVVVPVFLKDSDETPCTEITSLDDSEFYFGKWNLRTPKVIRPVAIEAMDMVFVPMVAFSPSPAGRGLSSLSQRERVGVRAKLRFARVGYGAGYYDRFLARLLPGVPKIGLAFGMQCVDHIPIEPHDVLLDDVITE